MSNTAVGVTSTCSYCKYNRDPLLGCTGLARTRLLCHNYLHGLQGLHNAPIFCSFRPTPDWFGSEPVMLLVKHDSFGPKSVMLLVEYQQAAALRSE